MSGSELGIIILAAGKGKRMGGVYPKVLFTLGDRPLIDYVVDTASKLNPAKLCLVVGFGREQVKERLAERDSIEYAVQEELLGTGHAVQQTAEIFADFDGLTLLLYGDVPLISLKSLKRLQDHHVSSGAAATVLSAVYDNPFGYGRIVRDANGDFLRIVEEKDASDNEREIQEINSGIYLFNNQELFRYIDLLSSENAQREYYITDMVALFREKGLKVTAMKADSPEETYGVNTPEQLEELERLLKDIDFS